MGTESLTFEENPPKDDLSLQMGKVTHGHLGALNGI